MILYGMFVKYSSELAVGLAKYLIELFPKSQLFHQVRN